VAGEVVVAGEVEITAPGLVNALPSSAVFVPEMVPWVQAGSAMQAAWESLHTPAQAPCAGQLRAAPETQVPLLHESPTVQKRPSSQAVPFALAWQDHVPGMLGLEMPRQTNV